MYLSTWCPSPPSVSHHFLFASPSLCFLLTDSYSSIWVSFGCQKVKVATKLDVSFKYILVLEYSTWFRLSGKLLGDKSVIFHNYFSPLNVCMLVYTFAWLFGGNSQASKVSFLFSSSEKTTTTKCPRNWCTPCQELFSPLWILPLES